jgi:hypothetical protein
MPSARAKTPEPTPHAPAAARRRTVDRAAVCIMLSRKLASETAAPSPSRAWRVTIMNATIRLWIGFVHYYAQIRMGAGAGDGRGAPRWVWPR